MDCLRQWDSNQRSRVTSETGAEMHSRMSSSGSAVISPEGVRGIEQATRAAHQRAPFGGVRRDAVEVVARETSRQLARERRRARDAEMDMQVRMELTEVSELAREDQVARGVGVVCEDD